MINLEAKDADELDIDKINYFLIDGWYQQLGLILYFVYYFRPLCFQRKVQKMLIFNYARYMLGTHAQDYYVNGNSGSISVRISPDREKVESLVLKVLAIDSANNTVRLYFIFNNF